MLLPSLLLILSYILSIIFHYQVIVLKVQNSVSTKAYEFLPPNRQMVLLSRASKWCYARGGEEFGMDLKYA